MSDANGPFVAFLTVGQLRAAMDGLSDDAQIVVTSSLGHTYDQGIVEALHSPLILWDHDCTDDDEGHKPGLDCPVDRGLELWIDSYDEASDKPGSVTR